jgi:transcription initiation factor TFIID TATA-box-binding protein
MVNIIVIDRRTTIFFILYNKMSDESYDDDYYDEDYYNIEKYEDNEEDDEDYDEKYETKSESELSNLFPEKEEPMEGTETSKFSIDEIPTHLRILFPRIRNVLSTAYMGRELDLPYIYFRIRTADYDPKRFKAVVVRSMNSGITFLIYSSGKVVSTGAKSRKESSKSMLLITEILKKIGVKDISLKEFRVHNIVASTDVRFPIGLTNLANAEEYSRFTTYEPEIFPSLSFRMVDPKVTIIIFVNGKIIFTGIKKEEQLVKAFLNIYPILVEFCKEDYKSRVLDREDGIFDFTPEMIKRNSPTRKRISPARNETKVLSKKEEKEPEFRSKKEEKEPKISSKKKQVRFSPKTKQDSESPKLELKKRKPRTIKPSDFSDPYKMKIVDLKNELIERGLKTSGKKEELAERVRIARRDSETT